MKPTKAKKGQRKLFRQKARLLINYLTVVQHKTDVTNTNVSQLKKKKTFRDSVKHLINESNSSLQPAVALLGHTLCSSTFPTFPNPSQTHPYP